MTTSAEGDSHVCSSKKSVITSSPPQPSSAPTSTLTLPPRKYRQGSTSAYETGVNGWLCPVYCGSEKLPLPDITEAEWTASSTPTSGESYLA